MPLRNEIANLQQLSPLVDLFTLDCTNIGGSVFHYSDTCYAGGAPYVFGGVTYNLLPIQITSMEQTAQGAQPQPSITISNTNKALFNAMASLGDLAGATVTRTRLLVSFLDGQSLAGTDTGIVDYFIIWQMARRSNLSITWTLASRLDQPGRQLPAAQWLKADPMGRLITDPNYQGFPGLSVYRLN